VVILLQSWGILSALICGRTYVGHVQLKIHTLLWQGCYTSTYLVSEEVMCKLKLQKAALYMYEYPEGELHNCSLTFEVILCTDFIL